MLLINFYLIISTPNNNPDQRLAKTVYTMHGKNIDTLCECFVCPRARANDPERQAIRNSIRNDRGDVRRFILEIMRTLKRMCEEDINELNFQRLNLRRADMLDWIRNTVVRLEQDQDDDVPEESEIEMNED